MSTREEELIIRLLEEERRRRLEKIVETGKINPEDALVVAVLDLSRRVGNVEQRVEKIEATMVTKEDIKEMATKDDIKDVLTKEDLVYLATKDDIKDMATKSDIKVLQWVLGIGLGVLTTVIGALAVLQILAH